MATASRGGITHACSNLFSWRDHVASEGAGAVFRHFCVLEFPGKLVLKEVELIACCLENFVKSVPKVVYFSEPDCHRFYPNEVLQVLYKTNVFP